MDYQLKRVAGAVHSAGNVLFDGGDRLFSAIGNRIACVDLRRQAADAVGDFETRSDVCLLYTSPSPRDRQKSRMPSSA